MSNACTTVAHNDNKIMRRASGEDGKNMSLDVTPEVAEGIYSNLVVISHSPSEFVIDFARIMPGLDGARVLSRIIMTPDHTKRLLQALEENLKRFEYQHGDIPLPEQDGEAGIPFTGNVQTEA